MFNNRGFAEQQGGVARGGGHRSFEFQGDVGCDQNARGEHLRDGKTSAHPSQQAGTRQRTPSQGQHSWPPENHPPSLAPTRPETHPRSDQPHYSSGNINQSKPNKSTNPIDILRKSIEKLATYSSDLKSSSLIWNLLKRIPFQYYLQIRLINTTRIIR